MHTRYIRQANKIEKARYRILALGAIIDQAGTDFFPTADRNFPK